MADEVSVVWMKKCLDDIWAAIKPQISAELGKVDRSHAEIFDGIV